MVTYKLIISYDGTGYYGWQEQPQLPTLEGLFKKRLKDIFNQEISFTGASRTDAGVHALGQVARCILDANISHDKLKYVLNNALPQGVLVRFVEECDSNFHPRCDVLQKTYYYHFFLKQPMPFVSRFGIFVKKLNVDYFKEALQIFKGTHDFRSFCTGDQARSTIKTINNLDVVYFKRFGIYQVRVTGPSFLRHMIRRIIGACIACASSDTISLNDLGKALASKDPQQQFFVAPPQGLLLHSICYK